MTLCIAGKITKENARKMAKKYFSGMSESSKKQKVKVKEAQNTPGILIHQKPTDQSHLVMGFRAYGILDSRKYALNLLAAILGGGMSSRLFISVRERLGLAYYVKCTSENHTDSGYLAVHAGLDNKKIDKAIKVIITELSKVKNEGVSEKELLKAKEYVKGKTMMGLEGSDDYGMWIALQEVLTNKTEDIDKKFKYIEKVTPKDIKDIAKDVIQNQKMNMAIIGPYKNKQRFNKYFRL
jgi:predicted Zn-dependent peptidase